MATYLVQVSYTSDGVAALVKNPQNRLEAVRPVIEKLGGKVIGFWYAFGDYDVVGIVEFPNNAAAAAFSLATAAGGAVSAFKTTPLMSVEEGMEAMRKAGGSGYSAPS